MMKMDSFGATEFATDFTAIFDKICNITLSPQSHNHPQPPQTQQQAHGQLLYSPPKNLSGYQKKGSSVSPRPFKRGESQPNAIGAAPQRRLRFREFSQNSEDVIEVADSSMTNLHSVFFGFIHNPSVNEPNSSGSNTSHSNDLQFNGFTRDDYCLERVLAECNTIKAKEGFRDGVLLKCIDSKPMFTYLHYALFNSGSAPRINNLIQGCDPNPKSQYGAFEELFAIQKSASSPDTTLPSNRHAGFIVSCFKLLEENFKQNALEKSWLSWTGAREIYKYSPRNWNLRKITLHRHSVMNGKIRTFGYVLLCEFGNILHPSNTIQALDMCERLRARNCGHIALYQVQCNYGQPPIYSHPSPLINHPSPTTLAPWGSPQIASRTSPKLPQRRNQRNPMFRGYSQDVESTTETTRRRSALLRFRDHSIGYDMEEPSQTVPPTTGNRFNSYQQFEELA